MAMLEGPGVYVDRGAIADKFGGDIDERTRLKRLTRKLRNELNNVKGKEIREEYLRELNPGLNELWEQYQTMLKLVD